MSRHVLTATAMIGLLALANGCTSAKSAPRDSGSIPSPEIAAPQPYDIYLGDTHGLVDYAHKKLRNECMAKAGYPQLLQVSLTEPRHPFPELLVTASTFGAANEEEARRRGFGPPEGRPAPGRLVSSDANFDKEFERCVKDAWARLGPDAQSLYRTYEELSGKLNGALMGIHLSNPPVGMAAKLADCITGKGYRIPDRESWLKKPSVMVFGVKFGNVETPKEQWVPKQAKGTVDVGPPEPPVRYIPTEDEATLAVAWFQCNQQTGVKQWYYDQAMTAQRDTVERYEAQFAELNPRLEQLARDAAALVGR